MAGMAKGDKAVHEPYKGVRDFYPEDQFVLRYIFEHMERVCELFGYEEYSASILEPAELYRGKTSEEIVNEQTYTFTDRGGREVTLRPEMTPTLARMIAAKPREIPFPPVGTPSPMSSATSARSADACASTGSSTPTSSALEGVEADAEIIAVAHGILRSLGADERDFEIRVSDRRILDSIYEARSSSPNKRGRRRRAFSTAAKK